MTSSTGQCADWLDLYQRNHDNPILTDILNLDNFPDESFATAGNKCR